MVAPLKTVYRNDELKRILYFDSLCKRGSDKYSSRNFRMETKREEVVNLTPFYHDGDLWGTICNLVY